MPRLLECGEETRLTLSPPFIADAGASNWGTMPLPPGSMKLILSEPSTLLLRLNRLLPARAGEKMDGEIVLGVPGWLGCLALDRRPRANRAKVSRRGRREGLGGGVTSFDWSLAKSSFFCSAKMRSVSASSRSARRAASSFSSGCCSFGCPGEGGSGRCASF